jgi:hypothetical protein
MNNITPRGRYIYLDIETYLEEYEMSPEEDNAAPSREIPSNDESENS